MITITPSFHSMSTKVQVVRQDPTGHPPRTSSDLPKTQVTAQTVSEHHAPTQHVQEGQAAMTRAIVEAAEPEEVLVDRPLSPREEQAVAALAVITELDPIQYAAAGSWFIHDAIGQEHIKIHEELPSILKSIDPKNQVDIEFRDTMVSDARLTLETEISTRLNTLEEVATLYWTNREEALSHPYVTERAKRFIKNGESIVPRIENMYREIGLESFIQERGLNNLSEALEGPISTELQGEILSYIRDTFSTIRGAVEQKIAAIREAQDLLGIADVAPPKPEKEELEEATPESV